MKFLNELYRNSEKAHPLLPDDFESLIEFSREHDNVLTLLDDSVSGGVGLYLYYIPSEKIEEIEKQFRKRYRIRRGELGFVIFDYAPTGNRKLFEKWKERLKDCEDIDCIVETIKKYGRKPD